MLRGTHVPLVSSFVLSSRKGKEVVVVPVVNRAESSYWFVVKTKEVSPNDMAKAKSGTKVQRGAGFTCLLSGASISHQYLKSEAMAGRMDECLLSVVTEAKRGRLYLAPSETMEQVARSAIPQWKPSVEFFQKALGFRIGAYGMSNWSDLFTSRQLVALTTFSDLTSEAYARILSDALTSGITSDKTRLADGGTNAESYADAVVTYLGFSVCNVADRNSILVSWAPGREHVGHTFGRQALPMVWDYSEVNVFSSASGCYIRGVNKIAVAVANLNTTGNSQIVALDACNGLPVNGAVVSTDPPYYDNIGYADLSDFFYVWLRRALLSTWRNLFRRLLVPKDEELVASPERHGGSGRCRTVLHERHGKGTNQHVCVSH